MQPIPGLTSIDTWTSGMHSISGLTYLDMWPPGTQSILGLIDLLSGRPEYIPGLYNVLKVFFYHP